MSIEQKTETRASLGDFIRETRSEIAKVSWPSRKETLTTTFAIIVMALVAGLFFLAVDWALGHVISRVLGMTS